MKKVSALILPVAIGFLLGCESKNTLDFPIAPYVEFRDLKFIAGNASSKPDTLKLKFYLRDGDFDLGLDFDNFSPPYNSLFVLHKITGQLMSVNDIPADLSNLVVYASRKTIDTLPPLNCSRWLITHHANGHPGDTIYVQYNPNYMNVFVDIYTEESNNVWTYFDPTNVFTFPSCVLNLFDGRFPPLPFGSAGPFKYQSLSSKEGILTLNNLTSTGIRLLFHNKKIKLKFFIKDQALHRSNIAETTALQL